MATTQSSIDGHYSGNNGNNNIYGSTVNNYNGQVPSYVPTGMQSLIPGLCLNL